MTRELPAAIRALDLDPHRTFAVSAAPAHKLLCIFTFTLKGDAKFVDIAWINEQGNVEFVDDAMCPCGQAPRVSGRGYCAKCRVRTNSKSRTYQRRRRRRQRQERALRLKPCTTESSSTPS